VPICDLCGNERESGPFPCRYCGHPGEATTTAGPSREFVCRTVNLKTGLPVAAVALTRMTEVIAEAARQGVAVLTLIHGYGSSGKGGVIREECRRALAYLQDKGVVREVIAGEDFHRKTGPVKALLRRYPQLAGDRNLNRGNRGVTLVVLSSWLLGCGLVITSPGIPLGL
jgi:hypothetical protein